jgi:hypothetical protein
MNGIPLTRSMSDQSTDTGSPDDTDPARLRFGRLSKGEFRLGEQGPLQSRWFMRVAVTASDYNELRTNAAHSALRSNVVQITEHHTAWVLDVQAGSRLQRFFVLLVGNTVADMLSDLVRMNLYLMLETGDGRVIELRVPTPDDLLFSLAKKHCAAARDEDVMHSLLRATGLLLSNQELDHGGSIPRFTVTAVLQPEFGPSCP